MFRLLRRVFSIRFFGLSGAALFLFPSFALAQTSTLATQNVQTLVGKIVTNIVDPLMALLIGVGLIVFMWGVVEFLWGLSTEIGDGKERGKRHMLWGVIGMVVMACAFGLLALVANTVCGGNATNVNGIQSSCGLSISQ